MLVARDFVIAGLHELRLMSACTTLSQHDASAELEALRAKAARKVIHLRR
jgi:hypothetical protein